MSTTPTPIVTIASSFHDHVRTWTFVILAIGILGFIYVHESNSNAANTALAAQIAKDGAAQQANIDKQLNVIHADTVGQVAVLTQQIQNVQTVQQAINSIRQNAPQPITITPIVTSPATATAPATTTAGLKADGTIPVAIIDGNDLKIMAANETSCKVQSIQLDACTQSMALEVEKTKSLNTEVAALKKVKLEPAWKKTLKMVGEIMLGAAIGRALR